MKQTPDVKTETNGSALLEKKEKKIKKSQSADSNSSKETRKDRKISRKRVCTKSVKEFHFYLNLYSYFSMNDVKILHQN